MPSQTHTNEPEACHALTAVPAEFAPIAAICTATEVEIGGKTVMGVADARDLHAGLGVRRDYTNWIKGRVEKYGFEEGRDFARFDSPELANQVSGHGGDRRSVTYRLTLDMAKELAMVENNDAGRLARRYFIWAEDVARRVMAAPPIDLISMVNAQQQSLAILGAELVAMRKQIAAVTDGFDPAMGVTDYLPMLTILQNEGVESRRRRQLSQRCSRRCQSFLINLERGGELRKSRETKRILFHNNGVRDWLSAEGRKLIREHRDMVAGQTVMAFPKLVADSKGTGKKDKDKKDVFEPRPL